MKKEELFCSNLTYLPEEKYTWDMNYSLVETANAQGLESLITNPNELLTVPFYIVIIFFLLFTVTMSGVYVYHWFKFNLNDPFIRNFSIVYFAGLCLLLIPIIFNLIN